MTEDEARERVIRSMCPDKVCRICGEPSRRIVEPTPQYARFRTARNAAWKAGNEGEVGALIKRAPAGGIGAQATSANSPDVRGERYVTTGFTDCGHDDWRPGKWFDPFQNQEGVMLTLGNIDEK